MSSRFDGKNLLFLSYFLIFCLESQLVSLMTFVGKTSVEQNGLDAAYLLMFKSCAKKKDISLKTPLAKISKQSEKDKNFQIAGEKVRKKTMFFQL